MGPQTDPSTLAIEMCTWVIRFFSISGKDDYPLFIPSELFCWKGTKHVGLYDCSVKCGCVHTAGIVC